MKKSLIIPAGVLAVSLLALVGGFLFIGRYAAEVTPEEETIYGDYDAAAGLKVEFRLDSGQDLHWRIGYDYTGGNSSTEFIRGELACEKPVNPYKLVNLSGSENYRIKLGSRTYTPDDEELHEALSTILPASGADCLVAIQEENAASGYSDCRNRLLILSEDKIYELPVKVTLSAAMVSKGKKSWLVPDPVPLGKELSMAYSPDEGGEYVGMSLSPDHSRIALFSVRDGNTYLELVDAGKFVRVESFMLFPAAEEMKYVWGDDGCLAAGNSDNRLFLMSGDGETVYSGEGGEGFYDEFFGDAVDVRQNYEGDRLCNMCLGLAAASWEEHVALIQNPAAAGGRSPEIECAVFGREGVVYRGILRSSISTSGVFPVQEENSLLYEP